MISACNKYVFSNHIFCIFNILEKSPAFLKDSSASDFDRTDEPEASAEPAGTGCSKFLVQGKTPRSEVVACWPGRRYNMASGGKRHSTDRYFTR